MFNSSLFIFFRLSGYAHPFSAPTQHKKTLFFMSRSPQGRYLISFFNLSIPLYNYLIHITLHSETLKKYSPFTAYISRKISNAKIHIFFDMEIFFRKNGKKDTLHAFFGMFACSGVTQQVSKRNPCRAIIGGTGQSSR